MYINACANIYSCISTKTIKKLATSHTHTRTLECILLQNFTQQRHTLLVILYIITWLLYIDIYVYFVSRCNPAIIFQFPRNRPLNEEVVHIVLLLRYICGCAFLFNLNLTDTENVFYVLEI